MHRNDYCGGCFSSDSVEEGAVFPVYLSAWVNTTYPLHVRCDFSRLPPVFNAVVDRSRDAFFADNAVENHFAKTASDADPKLLAILQFFTSCFEPKCKKLKSEADSEVKRAEMYSAAPDKIGNLSEVFGKNVAKCLEVSLLAKNFLDHQKIDGDFKSHIYIGAQLPSLDPDEDFNMPEMHAFLVLQHKGEEYVFDPTNPNADLNGNHVAKVLKPAQSLLCEEMKKKALLVECENVMTHGKEYFGVSYPMAAIPLSNIVYSQNRPKSLPVTPPQKSPQA